MPPLEPREFCDVVLLVAMLVALCFAYARFVRERERERERERRRENIRGHFLKIKRLNEVCITFVHIAKKD